MGMLMFWMVIVCLMKLGFGIRFVIDKEECFSHNILYEGDVVHASFVVIKADNAWNHNDEGVDFIVSTVVFFKLQLTLVLILLPERITYALS